MLYPASSPRRIIHDAHLYIPIVAILRFHRARPTQHSFGLTFISQSTGLLCHRLLSQIIFQQPSVARVRLENGVGNISEERNKTDGEIHNHVEQHTGFECGRKTALDLLAFAEDEEVGQKAVDNVADSVMEGQRSGRESCLRALVGMLAMKGSLPRDEADDGAPAKFEAAHTDGTV